MIEYDDDSSTMDIYCDGRDGEKCPEDELATYYGTWQECIDQAKEDGWVVFKDEDTQEWVHRCPACKRQPIDELFKD